jgi:ABC-2 type transport system ATP-binding protein
VRCDAGADPREELAAAVARNGWGLLELHAERLSLEDVFLKLTGEGK